MAFTPETASEIGKLPRNSYRELLRTITVQMPPSLLERLDAAKGDMSRPQAVWEAVELWLETR